jgi:hypothetical protein
LLKGFSKKYGCKTLVWYELHESMIEAITREKQIKAGSRAKKLALIESLNSRMERSLRVAGLKRAPHPPRHCERSEAIHGRGKKKDGLLRRGKKKGGLLRRCAPRNDEEAGMKMPPQSISDASSPRRAASIPVRTGSLFVRQPIDAAAARFDFASHF